MAFQINSRTRGRLAVFGSFKEDKTAYMRAMFTAIADSYDLINSLLSLRRDGAWRRFAASQSGIRPGGLALDVATGTGELARHLSLWNGEGTIIGIDSCYKMLLKAKAKLVTPSDGSRVELVLGDALQLPFPDNTFDCVTVGFGLRNVADIGAAFHEITRVAKSGARVVSLELTRPRSSLARALHNFCLFHIAPFVGGLISGSKEAYTYLADSIMESPSPEEVKKIMENAGLQEVEVYRLTLGIATVHAAIKRD